MAEVRPRRSTYAPEAEALVDAMAEAGRLSPEEERAARRCIEEGDATMALAIVTRRRDVLPAD